MQRYTQERLAASNAREVVAATRAAAEGWARTSLRERLHIVSNVRRRLAAEVEIVLGSLPNGRDGREGLVAEVLPLADACRFLERKGRRLLGPSRTSILLRPLWLFGVSAQIRREPFGIVLIVAPSNYPLLLPGVQLLQALVAGNGVVVKPAPGCTAPMALIAEWLEDAGLPKGVVGLLGESSSAVAEALDARVDKVVLTGSAGTGRAVAALCAERLVPSTMELSGNDAVFVLPGADCGLVARALDFGLRFNGSATCIAPRRVFVARAQAAELEARLAPLLCHIEPVTPDARTLSRVRELYADAVAKGARPLTPLPAPGTPDLGPVVVCDARADLALLREELFAPVLSIVPVRDMDEALEVAQSSPYALGASVFGPERAAMELAARVDAGSVTVNDLIVPTADPRLPFGGRRQSGWGVTRGAEGLLEMTQIKTVSVRRYGPRPHLAPPRPDDEPLLVAFFRALHGAARIRLGALADLAALGGRRGQRRDR